MQFFQAFTKSSPEEMEPEAKYYFWLFSKNSYSSYNKNEDTLLTDKI